MKKILTVSILVAIVGLMSGVANAAVTPLNVPDAGTTSFLVVIALGALTAIRRFVR